ncbi:hypothetical protein DB346_12150 [Verrucomicrobia bacterium LW23]|nr:hypothetical protein DB346_12150 [Verrucomicrobia bacterium LW23]
MEAAGDPGVRRTAAMLWAIARPLFAKQRGLIALYLLLSVLTLAVVQGAATLLLARLTDTISAAGPASASEAAASGGKASLLPLFAGWLGVLAAGTWLGYAHKYCAAALDSRLAMDLQRQVFTALLRRDPAWFHAQGNSPGELVMLVSQLTTQVQVSARALLVDGAAQVLAFVVIVGVLVWSLAELAARTGEGVAPAQLWLLFGAVALLGAGASWWINRRGPDLHAASSSVQTAMQRMNTLLTSVMTSPDEVKVLRAEALFAQQHAEISQHLAQQRLALAAKIEAANTLRGIPADLVQACLIGAAIAIVLLSPADSALRPGVLVVIVGLTPQFMMILEAIAGWRAEAAICSPAVLAVRELLDTERDAIAEEARDSGAPASPALTIGPQPQVRLDDVCFAYPPASVATPLSPLHATPYPVLDGASALFPAGKITALVAPSGMGKTTLFRLLLRFYNPQSGNILLDETPLSGFPIPEVRSRCMLISQRPAFFQGTVRTNFLAGRPDVTDTELRTECERYGLWGILTAAYGPQPLDAQFFSGSVSRLSGGQEKRFALVRGLLNSPHVLLLDEPTTGIDPLEKSALTGPLTQACTGRTVIVVDHDILWQTALCEHVVVLDRGRVVDQGPKAELMAGQGPFREMYLEAMRGGLAVGGAAPAPIARAVQGGAAVAARAGMPPSGVESAGPDDPAAPPLLAMKLGPGTPRDGASKATG